ncbi:MAG: hypothetical protein RL134_1124 [Actinomycetota bacterium]
MPNPFVDEDIPQDAQVFVLLGVLIGAMFGGLLVFFISGEILSDPGGAQGALFVVAWIALPAALAVLALVRPQAAYPILVVMVGLVLLAALATIPFAQGVWEFEDTHGPINLVVLIGALIPLIALGRAMPWRAGWLLIALIAGAAGLQAISLSLVGQWSVILVFAVLMPPFVAAAILFVIGGARARRDSNPQPTG